MGKQSDSGFNEERLNLIPPFIQKEVESGLYDGGVILVARHGEIVLHEAVGFADRENNRPCRTDDVFWLMSTAKAFTSIVLCTQIEKGKLSLSTRVNEIIPEFKGTYKDQVTVFHLMTQTAGSPYGSPKKMLGDLKTAVAAACEMRLSSPPGTKVEYSPVWAPVLQSEIICRVDGENRNLKDVYQDNIFDPLKMKDTTFGQRSDLASRMVPLVNCGDPEGKEAPGMPTVDLPKLDRNQAPPNGIASTALDLFRFAEMLRRGGELDGVHVLSPAMVNLATTSHTDNIEDNIGVSAMFVQYGWPSFPLNMGFEIGVRGSDFSYPSPMGALTSPRTYGRFGMGSTGFWVDPDSDVTFVFLSAGLMPEYPNTFRFQRLADMVMAAVI